MLKWVRYLIWLVVVVVLVVLGDQFLMRQNLDGPGIRQAQQFYRDFRKRLLTLHPSAGGRDQIGQTIEQEVLRQEPDKSRRYLYVDGNGVLHFADSLQQVPAAYRQGAQPLAD